MTETAVEEKATNKSDQWRGRIAAYERSGMGVRQFCRENGIAEHSFYGWRKRLREQGPVRFALVDRRAAVGQPAAEAAMELVFPTGERLRIGRDVEAGTLRRVVEALRG